MQSYVHIGKIVAGFGLRGVLIVQHALGNENAFSHIKAIFIQDNAGSFLPYFIEQAKPKTVTETYVKLEGINTREQTNDLLQKKLWLIQDDFRKAVHKNAPLALLGFQLIEDETLLGTVEEVIEQPHQLVVKTTIQNAEVFIPLHEHTLKDIDYKHQTIYVSLPEGLIDVYKQ